MNDDDLYNMGLCSRLELVYTELSIFSTSETDEEIRVYYDCLLDSVQQAINYIKSKEKEETRPVYNYKQVCDLNNRIKDYRR